LRQSPVCLEQITRTDQFGNASCVCSRGRNNLVLAAFLDYCCEPDGTADDHKTAAAGVAGHSAAGALTAATQAAQLASNSSSTSSSSSGMLSGQQQQEDDEEAEPDMLLSMAGKRAVRKAIGFAVDIEHAEALNTVFLQAGGSQLVTLANVFATGLDASVDPYAEASMLLRECCCLQLPCMMPCMLLLAMNA
jgi:hypothetical protein